MDPRAFMSDGGELGARIRDHDWSSTPMGAPEGWPQGLKTALRTALTTRHPIFIFWGPDHVCFYNDGYRPSLGPEKHPSILGAPGAVAFAELWDIIGPQIGLLMHGEGATWHENHLVPSLRHGRLDEVYWTYSYGPIDDDTAANGVGGVLVICTETTEQVRNAGALRDNQLALQRLNDELEGRVAAALAERRVLADVVEATDAFVQVVDSGLRWVACNEAAAGEFARVFGVRPEVGGEVRAAVASRPDQGARVLDFWTRALAGEGFSELQAFVDAEGTRRSYELRLSPLRDAAGTRIGAYLFAYDVTARLAEQTRLSRAEDALRQSQKVETLGQLTGGVAHDFNNLLTPVMGALDFARLEMRGDTEAQALIAVGLQAAERARTLVQRLLAFARRQHLQPQDVDVATVIAGMSDMALRSLRPGIELVLDIAPALPPAHVDPDQLVLALLNLAVNARDAMPGNGRLTVRARALDAGADDGVAAGRYVRIDVVDDGLGMDVATLRRASEPFFTTKAVGQGTGLGLSAVQGLALQSGGGFRLDSAPGRGTTASLWLPAATRAIRVDAAPAAVADADAVVAPGHAVLLVDDDELVRTTAAAALRRAGHHVIEASSGAEGLRMLRARPDVDLLVTDYAMPGMTGIEFVREARRSAPTLRALLVTGYADLQDDDVPVLPRLAKPFRPAELCAAVAAQLRAPRPDSGDA